MGRRRAAIFLVALLVGGACSGDDKKTSSGTVEGGNPESPIGPQTYTIGIDAPSPAGLNLQAQVFLPVRVEVRPGDTVLFENLSTQSPHTVTFTPETAASADEPAPVTTAGLPNPLAFNPCYSVTMPPAGTEACPEPAPATPPPFNGSSFWNSGMIAPSNAAGGRPNRVSFTVAPETPVGPYSYSCLLHPSMTGVLEVVEQDDERDTPARVSGRGRGQRATVLANPPLAEPTPPAVGGPAVTSGWGDTVTVINRFAPAVLNVKAGQSVTWQGAAPHEPHTVTFESPFKSPGDTGVFTPGGVTAGGRYTGGFAHSGVFGPKPFPAETFSLVFTKPGTYSYVCVLHPGMAGQVVVSN